VLVERVREGLLKYHRIVLPEMQVEKAPPLEQKELQKLAKKIKDDLDEADAHLEIHKSLAKIRVFL
jgi:D-alanyl-D-alanine dipeptidase